MLYAHIYLCKRIVGQTAGPNFLKFFEETHGYLKIQIKIRYGITHKFFIEKKSLAIAKKVKKRTSLSVTFARNLRAKPGSVVYFE